MIHGKPEIEMAVLGCILHNPALIVDVSDQMQPVDFQDRNHRIIYEAMLEIVEDRGQIDAPTIFSRLEDLNSLDAIGGDGRYLLDLSNSVGSAANAMYYVAEVVKASRVTQLEQIRQQMGVDLAHDVSDPESLLAKYETALNNVRSRRETTDVITAEEAIYRTASEHDKGVDYVATGFRVLDNLIGGFTPGSLNIIGARPGVGKSALAMNIAWAAAQRGEPVAFISLEMKSVTELADRLISHVGGVSHETVRNRQLTKHHWSAVFSGMGNGGQNLHLIDRPDVSVPQLRGQCRRLVNKYGIRLIIVDYLQLLRGGSQFRSKYEEVSSITRDLKLMAMDLNLPLVVPAQVNRESTKGTGGNFRPSMAHLRDSGSIEQDASVIALLHCEENCQEESGADMGLWRMEHEALAGNHELIVSKSRNSRTGNVLLRFIPDQCRFIEPELARDEPQWLKGVG